MIWPIWFLYWGSDMNCFKILRGQENTPLQKGWRVKYWSSIGRTNLNLGILKILKKFALISLKNHRSNIKFNSCSFQLKAVIYSWYKFMLLTASFLFGQFFIRVSLFGLFSFSEIFIALMNLRETLNSSARASMAEHSWI